MTSWKQLDDELDAWRACDRRATLWWRDDDACRDSAALRRLLEIAHEAEVPVALATIPALLEPSLVAAVAGTGVATIVQHGFAHLNHAPPGARNWELGAHRPVELTVGELTQGRAALEKSCGSRFVPVLVPPWNRIDADVIARLPDGQIVHALENDFWIVSLLQRKRCFFRNESLRIGRSARST